MKCKERVTSLGLSLYLYYICNVFVLVVLWVLLFMIISFPSR